MPKTEAEILSEALRRDLHGRQHPKRYFEDADPAVRIIDCVLSLRNRYEATVVPRVRRFMSQRPEVRFCSDLAAAIREEPTPRDFMIHWLNFNSRVRGETLLGVADYLNRTQRNYSGQNEAERLRVWATTVSPQEYTNVGVKRFGIAGYQYLRMLFGANTAKPDVHIEGYVSDVLNRPVIGLEAVALLEHAARTAGVSASVLDGQVWELRATCQHD